MLITHAVSASEGNLIRVAAAVTSARYSVESAICIKRCY